MATIDAKDMIIGRMASQLAKKALNGEEINIVNCEEAVIVGSPDLVVLKYRTNMNRGTPRSGPFVPKQPNMLLKRMIRGMFSYKRERGADAYKRVMCYMGVPENLKNEPLTKIEKANVKETRNVQYIKLKDLCKQLGWDE